MDRSDTTNAAPAGTSTSTSTSDGHAVATLSSPSAPPSCSTPSVPSASKPCSRSRSVVIDVVEAGCRSASGKVQSMDTTTTTRSSPLFASYGNESSFAFRGIHPSDKVETEQNMANHPISQSTTQMTRDEVLSTLDDAHAPELNGAPTCTTSTHRTSKLPDHPDPAAADVSRVVCVDVDSDAGIVVETQVPLKADALASADESQSNRSVNAVVRNAHTGKDEPVVYTHACFLCDRKFVSLDHLRKHQAKSALHKSNQKRQRKQRREEEEEAKKRRYEDDNGNDDELSGECFESPQNFESNERQEKHVGASHRAGRPRDRQNGLSWGRRRGQKGPIQVWKCSVCLSAIFDNFPDAFDHESHCASQQRRNGDFSSFTDRSRDDEELEEIASAKKAAREKREKEKKLWNEEDEKLKASGSEQGGKGRPFNLSASEQNLLSDYNLFILENVELFECDRAYNDQLVSMAGESFYKGTWKGKLRAEGTVGIRCVHCRHRTMNERAAFSCTFPGSLSTFGSNLHQITSSHWPKCKSLPASFRADLKRSKDMLHLQTYMHGKIGITAFVEKMEEKWKLVKMGSQGLKFAGTKLVMPDYYRPGGQKPSSNGSSDSRGMAEDEPQTRSSAAAAFSKNPRTNTATRTTAKKRGRGRPRLSEKEKAKRIQRKTGSRKRSLSTSVQVPFILSTADDRGVFSSLHSFLRDVSEVFVVETRREATKLTPKNCPPLKVGDVGIRCSLCRRCSFFPASVDDIYQKVRRVLTGHVAECDAMTATHRRKFFSVQNETRSPLQREQYKRQAAAVGLYDLGPLRPGVGLHGATSSLLQANRSGSDSSSGSSAECASDDVMTEEDASDIDAEMHPQKLLPTPGNLCIVEGCTKYRQHKCNSMCMAHYTVSLEDEEDDSNRNRESESSSSAESDREKPLVVDLMTPQERSSVTKYRLKLLSNLQLCYLSERDISKSRSRKNLPFGLPGIRCRHCRGHRCYASSPTVLWSRLSPGALHSHFVSDCEAIHYKIKAQLGRLLQDETSSMSSLHGGALPTPLRTDLWQRMVHRAMEEKYLGRKHGKKLLKVQSQRDGEGRGNQHRTL